MRFINHIILMLANAKNIALYRKKREVTPRDFIVLSAQ